MIVVVFVVEKKRKIKTEMTASDGIVLSVYDDCSSQYRPPEPPPPKHA